MNTKSAIEFIENETIAINLDLYEQSSDDTPHIVEIKKTKENAVEFVTMKFMAAENVNLRVYSSKLLQKITDMEEVMQHSMQQYSESYRSYVDQVMMYEEKFTESNQRIREMQRVIDSLKNRLIGEGISADIYDAVDNRDDKKNEE